MKANLTTCQLRLLTALRESSEPLPRVLGACRIPLTDLGRWLHQPGFRWALSRVLRETRRRREATLTLASLRAAERLADAVVDSEKLGPEQRRLCVDIVKLARDKPRRRPTTPAATSATPLGASAPAGALPVVEDLSEQERAELLRALERG